MDSKHRNWGFSKILTDTELDLLMDQHYIWMNDPQMLYMYIQIEKAKDGWFTAVGLISYKGAQRYTRAYSTTGTPSCFGIYETPANYVKTLQARPDIIFGPWQTGMLSFGQGRKAAKINKC